MLMFENFLMVRSLGNQKYMLDSVWFQNYKNLEKTSFEGNVLGLKVKGQKECNNYIKKVLGEQKF